MKIVFYKKTTNLVFLLIISKLVAFNAITISGSIVDQAGNPLPGANVLLINTSYGSVADIGGSYSITIPTTVV